MDSSNTMDSFCHLIVYKPKDEILEKGMVYHGAHPHFLPIVTENFKRLHNDSMSSLLAAVQMYAYPKQIIVV